MSDSDDFEADLAALLADRFGVTADVADAAAERIASFQDDWEDFDDAPAAVADRIEEAPYDSFVSAFNYTVGDIASEIERCTDSRPYRLEGGFDDVEAVQ